MSRAKLVVCKDVRTVNVALMGDIPEDVDEVLVTAKTWRHKDGSTTRFVSALAGNFPERLRGLEFDELELRGDPDVDPESMAQLRSQVRPAKESDDGCNEQLPQL